MPRQAKPLKMTHNSKKWRFPKWEYLAVIGVIFLFGLGMSIYKSQSSQQIAKEQTQYIILAIYQVGSTDETDFIDLMERRNHFEDSFEIWLNKVSIGQWIGASGGESVYEFWNYREEEILKQIQLALKKVNADHFKVQKRWYENDEWQNEFILEE